MSKEKLILSSIVKECLIHQKRMNYAYNKLQNLLPFTPQKLTQISEEEIAILDQFIYRFSKLQDAIGNKLFKYVLNVLGEDIENKSNIDIFNRLEQLEVIKNYDLWKSLRDLRNELAHEYENNKDESSELLNLLFKKKPELEMYLTNVINYLRTRGLLTKE